MSLDDKLKPASASNDAWQRFCEDWRRADEALESLPFCSISLTPEGLEIHQAMSATGRAINVFVGLLVATGLSVAFAPGLLGFLTPWVLIAGLMAYRGTLGARAERMVVNSDTATVEQLRKGKVHDRIQLPIESMYMPAARVQREEIFERALAADELSQKEVRSQLGRPGLHLSDEDGQRAVFGGELTAEHNQPLMGTEEEDGELEWLAAKVGAYLKLMRGAYEPGAEVVVAEAPTYVELDAWLEKFEPDVPLEHQLRGRLSNEEHYDFLRPYYAGEPIEPPAATSISRVEERDTTRFELPKVGLRGSGRRAMVTTLLSNLLMGTLTGVSAIGGALFLGMPWENMGPAWVAWGLFLAMLIALWAIPADQGRRAARAAFGRERIVLDSSGLSFERTILGWSSVDFIPVDTLEGVDVVADVYFGNNYGGHNVSSYTLLVYSFDAEPLRVASGRSKEELMWLASEIRDYIEAENGAAGVEYVLGFSAQAASESVNAATDEPETVEPETVEQETVEQVEARHTAGAAVASSE